MPFSLTKRSDQATPLSGSQLDQNWIALEDEVDLLGSDLVALATAVNSTLQSLYAPLASPALTGTPTAPTAATSTNTTQVATTAFVKAQLDSPALTGTPTAPTAATSTNTTQVATTAFVKAQAYAPLASPALTNTPTAPTAATSTNTTQVATTAFVQGEFAAKTVTSDTDVTATRLLKNLTGPAQAFRRGNILGTVSQSGGVPTGAAMEFGSNANGFYTRFANGMQICWSMDFSISHSSSSRMEATWTYPAAFSAAPFVAMSFGATGANYTDCSYVDMGTCGTFSHGTSSTNIGINKNTTTNFSVTAVATGVFVAAIGRWF